MAEPSRKKNKGRHAPNLDLVPEASQAESTTTDAKIDEVALSFWTAHPTEPDFIDLSEFATGRTKADVKTTVQHMWAGDYQGRPELIADLLPVIKQSWPLVASVTIRRTLLPSLRAWWRVLDEAERAEPGKHGSIARITKVEDLHELHYRISRKLKVSTVNHVAFVRLVNLRLKQKKQSPLYWPSPDSHRTDSDVPTFWEMEKIRHRLKHGWFATLDRWSEADSHQPDLWAWKKEPSEKWKEHGHAVYRAVVAQTGNALPDKKEIGEALGYSYAYWMPPLHVTQFGLYPSSEDARHAFHLCLLYSGWNVQTLLDVDIDGRFIEDHPTNPEYHLVYGFKKRGGTEHFCVGRNKRSDSPGAILKTLVERTKPLRAALQMELAEVEATLLKNKGDRASILRKSELVQCLKSPWLYVNSQGQSIGRLTSNNVNQEDKIPFLRRIIQEVNASQPANQQVRNSITPSDFRDAYIGFAYEFSNYSVLTAQVAATHKRSSTTQTYLGHKAWRAHSAKKVRELSTTLWREIKIHRAVDPAVLRSTMEHGEVSADERKRLDAFRKNRTRVGVGCKDRMNPPATVAPEHVNGSSCRVQRCCLCPTHAIVYDDSYDHLARRQAELEDIRDKVPVPVWGESSFPQELQNTEATLQLFAASLVLDRLNYWRNEIMSGRHMVISMEGAYT
jgi:hypothetical protein